MAILRSQVILIHLLKQSKCRLEVIDLWRGIRKKTYTEVMFVVSYYRGLALVAKRWGNTIEANALRELAIHARIIANKTLK
jgi:hypothetical protein